MNNQWKNLFILISNLIFNKKLPLSEPICWEGIMLYAFNHRLLPLAFEEAKNHESFKGCKKYDYFKELSLLQTVSQIKRTDELKKVYSLLCDNGIYPIVLKGIICRNMYREYSELRTSGDEDIYIEKKDFNKLCSLLNSVGYTSQATSDIILDNVQDIAFTSKDTELKLEVHINLFGTENSLRKRMNSYFENAFDSAIYTDIGGISFKTFNYTDNFLYLFLHIVKHTTSMGFGIRQIMDLFVFYISYKDKIDFVRFKSAIKELNLELFFSDLAYIAKKYLGFDLNFEITPHYPQLLLDEVLNSGIYGNQNPAREASSHIVNAAADKKSSKTALIFKAAFPSRKNLIKFYPELEKKPLLIIKIYFKRFGKFITKSKTHKKLLKESLSVSSNRLSLLKKYGIT